MPRLLHYFSVLIGSLIVLLFTACATTAPVQEMSNARQTIQAAIEAGAEIHAPDPKGIEVYRDKLVLYGCGDFLNDYEGIGGYELFRSELTLMYFATVDYTSGRLLRLDLTPMRVHRFRLERARDGDARWLEAMLNREGRELGTRVQRKPDNALTLRWG